MFGLRGELEGTPELATRLHSGRDGYAVVEDEPQCLVSFGIALAAGEHVLLDVLENGEPCTAGGVSDRLTGRAGRALFDDRGYSET